LTLAKTAMADTEDIKGAVEAQPVGISVAVSSASTSNSGDNMVSLDVINLSYDAGHHFIKDMQKSIKAAVPSALTGMLPDIKPYVRVYAAFSLVVCFPFSYFTF
jgi:hypothetical protein